MGEGVAERTAEKASVDNFRTNRYHVYLFTYFMSGDDLPLYSPGIAKKYWSPEKVARTRRLHFWAPDTARWRRQCRLNRRRGPLLASLACMAILMAFLILSRRGKRSEWEPQWTPEEVIESTLVFRRRDLQVDI